MLWLLASAAPVAMEDKEMGDVPGVCAPKVEKLKSIAFYVVVETGVKDSDIYADQIDGFEKKSGKPIQDEVKGALDAEILLIKERLERDKKDWSETKQILRLKDNDRFQEELC